MQPTPCVRSHADSLGSTVESDKHTTVEVSRASPDVATGCWVRSPALSLLCFKFILGCGCDSSRDVARGGRRFRSPCDSSSERVLGGGLVAALCFGCASSGSPAPNLPSTDHRTSRTCPNPVNVALPAWARRGFAHPTAPVPHLVGTNQSMVAVPFGWPLRDHQPPGHDNKILWIARSGNGPLHIVATEQATRKTVTKGLPDAPGPSIVNMPTAGCWRFALSWSDQRDEVLIRYYGDSAPSPAG
jgi:hypothetical protein